MKKYQTPNLWKAATLFFAATSIALFTLTAFTKAKVPQNPSEPQTIATTPVIATKTEAQALYSNFLRINPKFTQQGGFINKTTLNNLISKMTNTNDTIIYYCLGANPSNQNVIMLFNDPTYSPINDTPKFKTIAPFCPPSCNKLIIDYLTK